MIKTLQDHKEVILNQDFTPKRSEAVDRIDAILDKERENVQVHEEGKRQMGQGIPAQHIRLDVGE